MLYSSKNRDGLVSAIEAARAGERQGGVLSGAPEIGGVPMRWSLVALNRVACKGPVRKNYGLNRRVAGV